MRYTHILQKATITTEKLLVKKTQIQFNSILNSKLQIRKRKWVGPPGGGGGVLGMKQNDAVLIPRAEDTLWLGDNQFPQRSK